MRRFACLSAILLVLSGCGRLEPPAERGELVVGIRNAPAFYQEDGDGPGGFQYDLAVEFARELGLPLRVVKAGDPVELGQLLRKGSIHFAAPMAVADDGGDLRYTDPLQEVRQLVVQHADALGPEDIDELTGRTVEVVAGSSPAVVLKAIEEARRPLVIERSGNDELALLERVARRQSELAATDALHFHMATNFFPDLDIAFELPGTIRFAWAFRADGDPALFERARAFLERVRGDGTRARINDRYFGHIQRVRQDNIVQLLERMRTVLPDYRRHFVAAEDITGVDWRLLAALSFQESKWDPFATSPTGVRGMMMLTEDTADRMRVTNRLDPVQSIRAGAKYLAILADELPPEVKEPDRTWLALAAYNLGMGHLNGGRAIAKGLKRDPNSWYEMKEVLPLMARPEYYSRLKSGRARGGEAVIMVENVRTYYDVLARFEPPLTTALKPALRSD